MDLRDVTQSKKCCLNIYSQDDKCFLWRLLAPKHHQEITKISRRQSYVYLKYYNELKLWYGIRFPMSATELNKLAKLIKHKYMVRCICVRPKENFMLICC